MFSCTVEYSPIYRRACLQRLWSINRIPIDLCPPYLFFSETKLLFLACLIKTKVQIFRIKINALTKHEAVNPSLLWNKIRPCSSTEIISPTLRLLKFRKTYCFRWQPWITRVHEKEFNTLVIYPVPSFQIDAVGNWNGNSFTGILQLKSPGSLLVYIGSTPSPGLFWRISQTITSKMSRKPRLEWQRYE